MLLRNLPILLTFTTIGEQLALLDKAGNRVAVFEARTMN
jgi:hypothetical protein